MRLPAPFPPAPPSPLDRDGHPRLGGYAGALERVDLSPLAGRGVRGLWRRVRTLKRWVHALVATPDLVGALAIVDGGLFAGAFAWAADRRSGRMIFERSLVVPPGLAHVADRPWTGARASFAAPGAALRIERRSDRWQVTVDLGAAGSLDAWLDPGCAPPPFTLVAPVAGGSVAVTQKCGPLPVSGQLRAGGRTFLLDGGFATLDYTQGLLARETRWRWVSAAGRAAGGAPVALNLARGLHRGDEREDVLFVPGGPIPLPPCRFTTDEDDPLAPWEVASDDGAVSLRFRPVASHREQRNAGLVRSRFLQLAGTFDGVVTVPSGPVRLEALPGVVEDQFVRW